MAMTTNVGKTSSRRRGTSLLIVLVIALSAVVVAGVGAEFYARHKVTSCMSESLEGELGGPVDVSLDAKPLLLTALDHRVSRLSISSDDASISGIGSAKLQGFKLDSAFRDVRLPAGDGADGSIGSSEASIMWGGDSIQASLQTLPFGALITGVQMDEAANTMRVEVLGGVGSITLTPEVRAGAITMDTNELSAFGIGLPNDAAQQIIDVISGNLGEYPLGLAPQSIKVENDGLTVQLRGGQAVLPAAEGDGGSECSIF